MIIFTGVTLRNRTNYNATYTILLRNFLFHKNYLTLSNKSIYSIGFLRSRNDRCMLPSLFRFLLGNGQEMIFAGSGLRRCCAGSVFLPLVSPTTAYILGLLCQRAPLGDLEPSASHNFIWPDHGSPGTLWQMYLSTNFKLVPAMPSDVTCEKWIHRWPWWRALPTL